MQIDISGFGERCRFSSQAMASLEAAWGALVPGAQAEAVLCRCREQLFAGSGEVWRQLDALAEEAGIHRFTVHQLFLIFCAERTRENYRQAGYAQDLYWDSMKDLKAQTIAIFSYIDPIVAIILSALLLKENMGLYGVIGAVLVLGSTFISELPEKERN